VCGGVGGGGMQLFNFHTVFDTAFANAAAAVIALWLAHRLFLGAPQALQAVLPAAPPPPAADGSSSSSSGASLQR
jgi:hypothetical protein